MDEQKDRVVGVPPADVDPLIDSADADTIETVDAGRNGECARGSQALLFVHAVGERRGDAHNEEAKNRDADVLQNSLEHADSVGLCRNTNGKVCFFRWNGCKLDLMLGEALLHDLRYGARVLRGSAGFTGVAVLALGLGIGANTAVFTAYKALVTRPLDARDPGRMVNLALLRDSGPNAAFSYPDYEAYRDSARSFSGVIAFSQQHLTLSDAGAMISQRDSADGSVFGKLSLLPIGAGNAEFASVWVVSRNYFQVLGVRAVRGRTFELFGARELVESPSVLISENYWRRRFGGDPAIIGKAIRLNARSVTVAGITPLDFSGTGMAVPDFWLPVELEPLIHSDDRWLADRENARYLVFARLAPRVTISQARAEMTLLSDRVRRMHDPGADAAKPASAMVSPGSPWPLPLKFYGGLEVAITLIMAAAGMLLVVACANVGSLQLARARSRQRELRTRLSLGASRGRVIRQLLTECTLLALLAGGVALLSTWAFLRLAAAFIAVALPADLGTLIFGVTPDPEVFAYVFLISLIAGVLLGTLPAFESSRAALSDAERSSTAPLRSRRIQSFFVAAQVALSLAMMIAGSMLIHSAMNALKIDPGYAAKRVIDLELRFPEGPSYSAGRRAEVAREIRTRLAAIPGVAAITTARPPLDDSLRTSAAPIESANSSGRAPAVLCYAYVQTNYFETLGIPLRLGRGFQPSASDVILSQSAARELLPGQNPIGRSIRLGAIDERPSTMRGPADGPAYRVIGVVQDTRGAEFDGSDSRRVYLPLDNERLANRPILIRVQAAPEPILRAIEPMISSTDPDLIATISTLDGMLRRSPTFLGSSFSAVIASSLGLLGLLLASMGIYGTVGYIVLLRTREVGIRMAIGAQKRDILKLILGESTRPVSAGLLAGMMLSVVASRLLHGVLYGLKTIDFVSIAGVSALFLLIALGAAYRPARKALRVEPSIALRYE